MFKLMRSLIAAAALAAAASPAAAQSTQTQLDDLRMQQQDIQRRAIDQQNQLMALDAQARGEQAAATLQRPNPPAPSLRYEPSTNTPASTATPTYPKIPDSALADSNRRVREIERTPR